MLAHFVPPMVARGHGRMLNVASIAAFQPVPSLATYAATKAYVLSLTESLSKSCKGTGVIDHRAVPGHHRDRHAQHGAGGQRQRWRKLPGFLVGDADEVGRGRLRGLHAAAR